MFSCKALPLGPSNESLVRRQRPASFSGVAVFDEMDDEREREWIGVEEVEELRSVFEDTLMRRTYVTMSDLNRRA